VQVRTTATGLVIPVFELPYVESILLVRMGQKRIEEGRDPSLNRTGSLLQSLEKNT
jgi:hypothetical protein